MDQQINPNQPVQQVATQKVSAKLFAAKFSVSAYLYVLVPNPLPRPQSKRECYNFLAVDVGAYLPHFDLVTVYFLKDLANGKKNCK